MKHLKELVGLLPPEKIAQIELVGSNMDMNSKLGQLYFGLKNGDYNSEEEAIESIYGSVQCNDAFTKLKERLRDRLLNTLFFIDVNKPKFSDHRYAVSSSHLQYAQIKLLLSKSARKTGIWLAENLLEHTKKFELTDLTYLLSNDLKYHYGTLEINRPKYLKYDRLQKKTLNQLASENLAMDAYHMVFLKDYGKSKTSQKELDLAWQKNSKDLQNNFNTESTYKFLHFYTNAFAQYNFIRNDCKAIVNLTTQSQKLISKKKFQHQPILFSIQRLKMMAFFNLGRLDEAIELSNQIESLTTPNRHNWFIIRYFKSLFLIHKQEYAIANSVVEDTFKDISIDNLKSGLLEIWKALEAYLEFLTLYTGTESKNQSSGFRLNKFLNEVPLYQKDKKGRNVAVLLVQLLFLLVRNDYGNYIDRMDALNQYRQRYLKENNTYRANCIIRMMVKVGKYGFHPKRVKSYTQKDLWKLKARPPEISNSSVEVEIIPYEQMWNMVMEILEKNYAENF